MRTDFNKYQGSGNDFIMIDNRDGLFPSQNPSLISALCDRHYGIGADGLILITDHKDYSFEMHYFNADGMRGSMCGNGGRCAFAFSLFKGIIDGECSFFASDGVHKAKLIGNNMIQLSLRDVVKPQHISGNHYLDTGSPHYIIPVPNVAKVNVPERGRSIRYAEQFAPGGTNVNFIELLDDRIKVRTYERGVENETLSCGTGICASAISCRWGNNPGQNIVIVETSGGMLEVGFTLNDDMATNIYLKGPAERVFSGSIETDNYK